jgi:hypothetical protein
MNSRFPVLLVGICFSLSACVDTSAVRMEGNLARIDVSAAPIYGGQGATDIALKAAARETLKAGFTHFTIVDFGQRYDSRVVGVMPGTSTISGTYGPTTGNIFGSSTGPTPIVRARNERAMIIKMGNSGAYDANALLPKQ